MFRFVQNELSDCQDLSASARTCFNEIGMSAPFRAYQELSGSVSRFQCLSGALRPCQELSGHISSFQDLSAAYSVCLALSVSVSRFQGISATFRICQQDSGYVWHFQCLSVIISNHSGCQTTKSTKPRPYFLR